MSGPKQFAFGAKEKARNTRPRPRRVAVLRAVRVVEGVSRRRG